MLSDLASGVVVSFYLPFSCNAITLLFYHRVTPSHYLQANYNIRAYAYKSSVLLQYTMSTENELEKEMEEGELPEEGEITDDDEPKQTTGKDKPERAAERDAFERGEKANCRT